MKSITPAKCMKWIYGPQMSSAFAAYGVGNQLWFDTYSKCSNLPLCKYPSVITVDNIIDDCSKEDVSAFKNTVHTVLSESEDIGNVLLVHSAFINAFGFLEFNKNDNYQTIQQRVCDVYEYLYNETENILTNKSDIEIFVKPDVFKELKNSRVKRPPNIVNVEGKLENVLKNYQINTKNAFDANHPIPRDLRKCTLRTLSTKTPFDNIEDSIFKPLADVISCNYKFLKQKITEDINDTSVTFGNINKMDVISPDNDYEEFQNFFAVPYNNSVIPSKRIIIKDVPKTHLSQFIERLIPILYQPHILKCYSTNPEHITKVARKNTYYSGVRKITTFEDTTIFRKQIYQYGILHIPVIYIEKHNDGYEYFEYSKASAERTIKYFTNVFNDLFDLGVFKKMTGESQYYEINADFDIDGLECFKRLPDSQEKTELKPKITAQFFMHVGNLIHFAFLNNIKLKHPISLIDIAKILNLFDFYEKSITKINLNEKLLLCTIYLIEKAKPEFIQKIVNIMKNPESSKSLKMNSLATVFKTDRPIYDTDNYTYLLNLIEYIFGNAYFEYSYANIPNKRSFYLGFHHLRLYASQIMTDIPRIQDFNKYSFELKMNLLRKADYIVNKK